LQVWITYLAEAAADVEQSLRGLRRFSEAIDPPYDRARFPLNDALSLATERLRERVSQAGGEITAEILPAVEADYTRAVLIFQELLDNAIKFCPGKPPAIRISAETENAHVRVSVIDNGMGMEAKQHERIFRPFARLWGKRFPGAGMGLAIARAAVEMHGGHIWAKANKGEGSIFQFTLPTAA
jgi:signal transduction histidine kinase